MTDPEPKFDMIGLWLVFAAVFATVLIINASIMHPQYADFWAGFWEVYRFDPIGQYIRMIMLGAVWTLAMAAFLGSIVYPLFYIIRNRYTAIKVASSIENQTSRA